MCYLPFIRHSTAARHLRAQEAGDAGEEAEAERAAAAAGVAAAEKRDEAQAAADGASGSSAPPEAAAAAAGAKKQKKPKAKKPAAAKPAPPGGGDALRADLDAQEEAQVEAEMEATERLLRVIPRAWFPLPPPGVLSVRLLRCANLAPPTGWGPRPEPYVALHFGGRVAESQPGHGVNPSFSEEDVFEFPEVDPLAGATQRLHCVVFAGKDGTAADAAVKGAKQAIGTVVDVASGTLGSALNLATFGKAGIQSSGGGVRARARGSAACSQGRGQLPAAAHPC